MHRIASALRRAAAALICVAALEAGALEAGAQASPAAEGAPGFEQHLSAISALGPRSEGSEGEAAAFDYIARSLGESGLECSKTGFADAEEGYSTSRIVEARIPGLRGDELAVVVPVGTWADSRDPSDGAYCIALALDEAGRLARSARSGSACAISLRFVFLGAENRGKRTDGEAASLGSRTWIARRSDKSRLAVLYLSLGEAPAWLALRSAGHGVLSPYWYYDAARLALERTGIGIDLDANRIQAYRLGLASDYGAAAPYLEAGIPAIELVSERTAPGAGPSAELSSRWFGDFIQGFAADKGGGFGSDWDRHYFILQIGRVSAVLRERLYVAAIIACFSLVAISFLIATIARRQDAKRLLRRFPAIAAEVFALFVALALVFLAGKGVALIDALVLGSSESWRLFPRLFAAARILFSFLLFLSLLSFLVERRVLSPNPHFYELAALVCLVVDSLLFSAADLSASFYFLWALVLVELSLAIRRRWATLFAYLLMYVPLIVIAAELASRPDLSTYRKLIAPGFLGVLALSALTLPFFVFTASPLLFLARPGVAARKRAVFLFALCALAAEGFALAFAAVSVPLEGGRRRDLRIAEVIDQDAGSFKLELSGLRRLGGGIIERGGEAHRYFSLGDRVLIQGEDRQPRVTIEERTSAFLDREDDSVAILFDEPPYSVDIALESADEILIYDCSLPYRVAVDGKSAVIHAGVNLGKKLDLSLTVPSSFRARLIVKARYLASLGSLSQTSKAPLADDGRSVKASFDIGSRSP